jgi:hypothetical protein
MSVSPHGSLQEGTRRSFATDAIRQGVAERLLQRFFWHALISTRRYARLADTALGDMPRPRTKSLRTSRVGATRHRSGRNSVESAAAHSGKTSSRRSSRSRRPNMSETEALLRPAECRPVFSATAPNSSAPCPKLQVSAEPTRSVTITVSTRVFDIASPSTLRAPRGTKTWSRSALHPASP